ncbi:hypothetical protein PS914_05338 [Pseudomonas fluorescens]|nr:hypothetical protein PS914_05338 [Pseudomonas fluorescens]
MKTLAHPLNPERMKQGVAQTVSRMYRPPVAANSATGFGRPISKRRNSASITTAGAFFVPAVPCYGGCAWGTFGCAGFRLPRSTNLRTAVTNSFGRERGSSFQVNGVTPLHALIPSKVRAFAHRRMALSALHANSSLSVRLRRWNHHMAIVRTLEAVRGVV